MNLLTAIDLEDHWDRVVADPDDFPSFAIGARFGVVEGVYKLTELAIPRFQADALSEAHLDLARYREIYEPHDVEDWRHRLTTELRSTIPAAFRSASVFHLTGAHEQSVRDLARYVLKRQKVAPNQKNERDPFGVLEKMLGRSAFGNDDLQSSLRDLKLVRNALAHAGGYLHGEPVERQAKLQAVIAQDLGVSLEADRLIVSDKFLRISLSAAVEHLNLLMSGVMNAFPLSNAP